MKVSRRSFLKKIAWTAAGLVALPSASFSYARYAEPKWLDQTSVSLPFERLPKELDGLRIVQFSDVHHGFHYSAADLLKLAAAINRLQPEMICFTGDLVDYSMGADSEAQAVINALKAMQAPLGKFAVLGNHDYYADPMSIVNALTAGGFKVLRNEAVSVKRQGSETSAFWMAGVEDQWEGKPDIAQALKQAKNDPFVLLLSHCPDYADIAAKHGVDLQLSGHSHGGQVRLPFFGHLTVPKYAQKYVKGLYTLEQGKLQLYVNRGIGVSVYPVRFWCRPELTAFTLRATQT
ncbi:metallophosphoesterase [Paenibacillus cremeus]|uniref:Metallophosphoesterase n=1 Tax=Paenibacillus cremeus TaxID=2163881 RepID=A0A559KFC6_9BACL|nr:metallophosphoesterase [Paenibacillus cremeus]TVY10834.1 metallophosphoesterase [Paenibacillus cremeus]